MIQKKLKPNEKLILLHLKISQQKRFSLKELSVLTGIHRSNLLSYVKNLAEKDLIDLIKFSNCLEVNKK